MGTIIGDGITFDVTGSSVFRSDSQHGRFIYTFNKKS